MKQFEQVCTELLSRMKKPHQNLSQYAPENEKWENKTTRPGNSQYPAQPGTLLF